MIHSNTDRLVLKVDCSLCKYDADNVCDNDVICISNDESDGNLIEEKKTECDFLKRELTLILKINAPGKLTLQIINTPKLTRFFDF